MSLENTFARKLYHARTSAGYTATQVAHAAGISLRWYQCLEHGNHLPGPRVMLRLMWLLQLDPSDFQGELDVQDWDLFVPVEQHLYSEELGHYITYGVRILSHGQNIAFLSDVSCSKSFATAFAKRCTQFRASPLHARELVLDALQ